MSEENHDIENKAVDAPESTPEVETPSTDNAPAADAPETPAGEEAPKDEETPSDDAPTAEGDTPAEAAE